MVRSADSRNGNGAGGRQPAPHPRKGGCQAIWRAGIGCALLWGAQLSAPAVAASVAHRCEAVFVGPSKECELLGTWTVSSAGRNEDAARKLVLDRLSALMVTALDERALRTAGTPSAALAEAQRKRCPAAAPAAATVVCYPEPALATDQLCFAQLRNPECYRGPSIDLQGVGYKMAEKGRDMICTEVDVQLSVAAASELTRLSCAVECMQKAEVRCTASGTEK